MKHYRQLLLVLTFVIACLCLSHPFFTEPQISFSAQIEAESDFKARVFWTEDETQKIDGKLVVTQNVSKDASSIQIVIPTKKLYKFRFDFGQKPGKVIISDMKIRGNKTIILDPTLFRTFHDVESHKVVDNKLVIESEKKNPYMLYSQPINIFQGSVIDWCLFLILSCVYWFVFSKSLRYLGNFKILENHSRIDIVFVGVFFILLFIPMMHISHAEKSEQENRTLATKPHLFSKGELNSDFGKKFNDWFNDRFWGRNFIVGLYNYTKFLMEPHGQSTKAMIGKNGFLYTKGFNSPNLYANNNLFTKEELELAAQNIEKFIKDAKATGIKDIYFMLSNDKESLYPEYYPPYIQKVGPVSRLEQLLDYIHSNHPTVKFFNFREKFEEIKKDENLFYKTGTHMNHIGAYYEYYFLMNEIKKDYPEITVLALNDFKIRISDDIHQPSLDMDIYNSFVKLPLYSKKNFENKILEYDSTSDIDRKKTTDGYFIKSRNKKLKNKLKALTLGDSFSGRYYTYTTDTFYKMDRIFWGGGHEFKLTPEQIEYLYANIPDILIVASTERFLQRFLTLEFPKKTKKEN